MVLAYRRRRRAGVGAAFADRRCVLLDALEREPREPVLLNYAGVLLYELLRAERGGRRSSGAALRLDPELAHAAANLEHARAAHARTDAAAAAVGTPPEDAGGTRRRARKVAAQRAAR